MFSKIVVLSALVAVALSAALQEPVPILSQEGEVNPDGSYQYSYQSGDGSSQQQSGQLVGSGEAVGESVKGSASWVDSDGQQHQLNYVADENGYQPDSADLPVPPPVPEIPAQIQKALDWIAQHPQPEEH